MGAQKAAAKPIQEISVSNLSAHYHSEMDQDLLFSSPVS